MRGGNGDGSDLVQAHHADPELPAALEGEHDGVAFLQAVFGKEVGGLVAQDLQISEGDDLLLSVIIAPDQSTLLRIFCGIGIHYIISEIEILGNKDLQVLLEIIVGFEINPRDELGQ